MRRFASPFAARSVVRLVAGFVARCIATVVASAALFTGSTGSALAQSADDVRVDFARAVYLNSAAQVHDDRPQPLLRAVVVLRIKLDAQNHWQAEVFRENSAQPDLTRAALESVSSLPSPVGLTAKAQDLLHGDGVVEAWLFQNDGRFALKTLAKPQRSS